MKGREFLPQSRCHISTVPQHHVTTKSTNPDRAWSRRAIRTSCPTVLHLCSCRVFRGSQFWDALAHCCVLECPLHQSGSLPRYGEGSAWTSLLTFVDLNFLLKIPGFYLIYSFDDNFLKRKKNHLLFTFTFCAIFLEELNEYH